VILLILQINKKCGTFISQLIKTVNFKIGVFIITKIHLEVGTKLLIVLSQKSLSLHSLIRSVILLLAKVDMYQKLTSISWDPWTTATQLPLRCTLTFYLKSKRNSQTTPFSLKCLKAQLLICRYRKWEEKLVEHS